jgi:Trk K+ transport system NAD-binding subunit
VAEACAANTPLAGQSLATSQLRSQTGVTVVGTWDRGTLTPVTPDTVIKPHSVLLLAGSKGQIDRYSELFGHHPIGLSKVIIIGGGNVGQSTARLLDERGIDWTLIERQQRRLGSHPRALLGDATEFDTLVKAGLQDAATVIITTHDDETNLFLTILCRRLRRRLQVITRCTDHSYVDKLHRAGADLVLSYASMMANSIFNFLSPDDTLLLAEGVNLFPSEVPAAWVGVALGETQVRELTGCSILAVETAAGRAINPPPDLVLPAGGKLVLIGSLKAKTRFVEAYFKDRQSRDGAVARWFRRIFG